MNNTFIAHLTRAQRTPSAAASVQVSYALPAGRSSCLLRGRGASVQDGVAAGKGLRPPSPLATPFAGSNTMRFLSLGVRYRQRLRTPLPMSLRKLRDWITHALQTITADTLHRVWDAFDYRVDVCRVTQGANIEGL